ncbi:unnamed protein product [Tilletia laevis]|uniref:Uncharacterized protein n=1 Tax=Tilletia laevis TaxID=157183 RepID=A0A9N8LQ27_9BASI|nr:hypothetical protein CF336_g833 [Tilletia laevis]CAD6921314.1 unnamed protein product [Tilletia laevis]
MSAQSAATVISQDSSADDKDDEYLTGATVSTAVLRPVATQLRTVQRPLNVNERRGGGCHADDGDEYDLENLPEAYIGRVPPDVTVIQAIEYTVHHGIVAPDFDKKVQNGEDEALCEPASEKGVQDDEYYNLDNLPDAFVRRIPPGLNKLEAVYECLRSIGYICPAFPTK